MRCEKIREVVERHTAQEVPAAVREHLAACPACGAYARDWRLVRGGLRALAGEPVPEASLGFRARLVRRLEEARETGSVADEFVERVGRRVVFATLLLALTVLLALVLPSAGPVRGAAAAADLFPAQSEIALAENDPIFAPDYHDNRGAAPTPLPREVDKVKK
jgi:anti-sigma factor RsiW